MLDSLSLQSGFRRGIESTLGKKNFLQSLLFLVTVLSGEKGFVSYFYSPRPPPAQTVTQLYLLYDFKEEEVKFLFAKKSFILLLTFQCYM